MSEGRASEGRASEGRVTRDGMIVLVGAPGSGKSTVGALVANRLGVEFVDVDAVIEARAGKSVAEIFADDGEPAFRAVEEHTTQELLASPGVGVLSLGGGAVTSPSIRTALAGHRVIWLKVSAAEAARRVGFNEARPLLLGNVRGQLVRLLAERAPLYAAVASETVDTDHTDPADLAARVLGSDA